MWIQNKPILMACHEKGTQDFSSFFIEERLTKRSICLKASLKSFSAELFFQKQANSWDQERQHRCGAGAGGGHSPKVHCVKASPHLVRSSKFSQVVTYYDPPSSAWACEKRVETAGSEQPRGQPARWGREGKEWKLALRQHRALAARKYMVCTFPKVHVLIWRETFWHSLLLRTHCKALCFIRVQNDKRLQHIE